MCSCIVAWCALQLIISEEPAMVNAVDIIVPLVVTGIIIAVSIYLFTIYCHPEQRGFGNAVVPKILVIISQLLAWGQMLLLPLDIGVDGANPQSSFHLAYQIIYPTIFILVAFVNPLMMFFYESDENDAFSTRLFWSFIFSIIVAAIWIAFTFISYVWLGVYTNTAGQSVRLNASLYIFLILSLVGWVLLAFNGAVGLIYLPYDLITYFSAQPKPLTTDQAFAKKQELQKQSGDLIGQGQKLKNQQEELRNFEGGWFSRKRSEARFEQLFEAYKNRISKLQDEFQLFSSQIQQRRHPIVYIAALIFGIFAVFLSLVWVIQMFGTVIHINGGPLFHLLDNWFADMANSGASFVSTMLYGALVIYMQICLVKGNCVFGIRIPYLLKMHPMVVNKTYMNSILFNCNLMLLASTAINFQGLWAFPNYFTPTSSFLALEQYNQIFNLPLFGTFYGKRIPMMALLILVLVIIIFLVLQMLWYRCCKKEKKEETAVKATVKA